MSKAKTKCRYYKDTPHLTTRDLEYLHRNLRKLSLWYSQRKICLKDALVSSEDIPELYKGRARNFYKCKICRSAFRIEDINVDHVVDVNASSCETIGEYVAKMLPKASDLQVLCINCHSFKNIEQELGL